MRRSAIAMIALCVSATAFAQPFEHSSGEYREYLRDWLAACPNFIDEEALSWYGYSCFASTASQELNSANHPVYKLTMVHNRLDGVTDLAITIAHDRLEYDPSRPLQIRFGGLPIVELTLGSNLETRDNTSNQFFISDRELADFVLDKMKERTALTLAVPLVGVIKPVEVRLSTQGVLASMDFMSTYARRVAQY